MCVASAVEGLVKLDPGFVSTPPDFTTEELASAQKVISELEHSALRNRLTNSVALLGHASVTKYLSQMQLDGRISKSHLAAWKKVRNQVVHGNLFEPWGSREEHERIASLIELFYRLTGVRIGYAP